MTDNHTVDQRKKNMQAIKSISKLEEIVSKALWKKGLRFRRNVNTLFGKPDIAIKKYKIVIFIDSCFWHCCPLHGNIPKSNVKYWEKKLQRNIERDKKVNSYYTEQGWHIIRIWEHEIKRDLELTINKILCKVNRVKKEL